MSSIKIINCEKKLIHGHSFLAHENCKSVSSYKELPLNSLDNIVWCLDLNSINKYTEAFLYFKNLNITQTLYIDQDVLRTDNVLLKKLIDTFDNYMLAIDTLNDPLSIKLGYPDDYVDFVIQFIKLKPQSSVISYVSDNNLYFFAGINDLIRNFGVKSWSIISVKALIDYGFLSEVGLPYKNANINNYIEKITNSPEEILPKTLSVKCYTKFTDKDLGEIYFID